MTSEVEGREGKGKKEKKGGRLERTTVKTSGVEEKGDVWEEEEIEGKRRRCRDS